MKTNYLFIMSGTKVIEGKGLLLILAVGKNSVMGRMREKIQE